MRKIDRAAAEKARGLLHGAIANIAQDRAVRYRVIEEVVALEALRREREALREMLQQEEPDAVLLERARAMREAERQSVLDRLQYVERTLEELS